jgi:sialic acid synthase SpsE
MTKLYANISVDHQNQNHILEGRIVAAAQCNADAVVIHKTTPGLIIPEEKKYVPVSSRWGTISYIDFAKRCELDDECVDHIIQLCRQIGIPIIWCVTDNTSAEYIKNHTDCDTIKIHSSSVNIDDLAVFCSNNFDHVIYPHTLEEYTLSYYKKSKDKNKYSLYYTPSGDVINLETLNFKILDSLTHSHLNVGYESRTNTLFPCVATAYKGIEYIEKYLGDADNSNDSVMSPQQFYDLYKNLEILEIAHG